MTDAERHLLITTALMLLAVIDDRIGRHGDNDAFVPEWSRLKDALAPFKDDAKHVMSHVVDWEYPGEDLW